MGMAVFGEIRVYLKTGLCIKINDGNTTSVTYTTIEPGTTGFVEFTAENACGVATDLDMTYGEYYGHDLTGIHVSLADSEGNDLALPHSIPANTLENLKIKIVVDEEVAKNQQFLVRTYWQSIEE